jgi:hypothetical protein
MFVSRGERVFNAETQRGGAGAEKPFLRAPALNDSTVQ